MVAVSAMKDQHEMRINITILTKKMCFTGIHPTFPHFISLDFPTVWCCILILGRSHPSNTHSMVHGGGNLLTTLLVVVLSGVVGGAVYATLY